MSFVHALICENTSTIIRQINVSNQIGILTVHFRHMLLSLIHTDYLMSSTESMHQMFLEARARGTVCAGPPQGAAEQRLGASGAGGADQHAAALWQDHFRVDVRGGDDVGGAERRDQHLQHVQAHLAEAATQLHQVLLRDMQAGSGGGGLQGAAAEHGGDRAARPRRRARPARGELVPEQGQWRAHAKSLLWCCAKSGRGSPPRSTMPC